MEEIKEVIEDLIPNLSGDIYEKLTLNFYNNIKPNSSVKEYVQTMLNIYLKNYGQELVREKLVNQINTEFNVNSFTDKYCDEDIEFVNTIFNNKNKVSLQDFKVLDEIKSFQETSFYIYNETNRKMFSCRPTEVNANLIFKIQLKNEEYNSPLDIINKFMINSTINLDLTTVKNIFNVLLDDLHYVIGFEIGDKKCILYFNNAAVAFKNY